MDSDLLFLILILGVPVTVIALLTRFVMRKMFVSAVFERLADANGWKYTKSGEPGELQDLLDRTLFEIFDGNHRLYNILETCGTFLCDYHYSNRGIPGHRRGSDYALAVAGRNNGSRAFWAVRPYESAAGRPLAVVTGDSLRSPDDPEWNWLLFSSVEAFEKAGWTSVQADALKSVMEQGSLFYSGENKIIIMLPGFLHTRKIVDLKKQVEKLSEVL